MLLSEIIRIKNTQERVSLLIKLKIEILGDIKYAETEIEFNYHMLDFYNKVFLKGVDRNPNYTDSEAVWLRVYGNTFSDHHYDLLMTAEKLLQLSKIRLEGLERLLLLPKNKTGDCTTPPGSYTSYNPANPAESGPYEPYTPEPLFPEVFSEPELSKPANPDSVKSSDYTSAFNEPLRPKISPESEPSSPSKPDATSSNDGRGIDFNTKFDAPSKIGVPDEGGIGFGDKTDFSLIFEQSLCGLFGFLTIKYKFLMVCFINFLNYCPYILGLLFFIVIIRSLVRLTIYIFLALIKSLKKNIYMLFFKH